ncbi:hypothetical protein Dda_8186 [Drechslerella dactyloides]|uniref:GOLD domain-containing protein n=1 Tax=Drechslerella dactyloides TaxID=74499 RepID=A0AAD6IRY0_DREDA|nr:hypothetical protein Dda_8186 [Drechslerella dactyloides]
MGHRGEQQAPNAGYSHRFISDSAIANSGDLSWRKASLTNAVRLDEQRREAGRHDSAHDTAIAITRSLHRHLLYPTSSVFTRRPIGQLILLPPSLNSSRSSHPPHSHHEAPTNRHTSHLCRLPGLGAQAQQPGQSHRCIRNFAAKDTLVVVTTIISGSKGDGQKVNIHIKDAVGNEYGKPKDVVGENRMAFTSHADAAFDVCFDNVATNYHRGGNQLSRSVELDVDIGADARDWSAIQAAEKLKPVEIELRRIEELVGEIVTEMEYLRTREQKLRDTNESTNERVKWFAFATISTLIGLGAWQVVYLRSYFRSKHLI